MSYKMVNGRRYRTCRPSGGKIIFKTEEQAKDHLDYLRSLPDLRRRESRVYSCDMCQRWHTTKKTKFYPSTVGKRS